MHIPFRTLLRRIRRVLIQYEPLITVSISKEHLLHNLHSYKEAFPNVLIAPVLKSNAYGHGLVVIAELLDREGIAFFMVDSLYEAKALRQAGIRSRIVVMGYVRPEYIAKSALQNTDYAVTDIEQLRTLVPLVHKPIRIHLKLDTGMHRQGIVSEELPDAIALIKQSPLISVVGVCTHLADADNEEASFTKTQLSLWSEGLTLLSAAFPAIEYKHAAATKGASWSTSHPMNVVRVGMGLYGYDTSPSSTLSLKPVLSMRSFVTSIREIPAGDAVGYNATFVAETQSRIATIPAGYYEGIDRALSNTGILRAGDSLVPIAGRVSMNMTSLDVTGAPHIARGDVVTVISTNPKDPNSILSMARLAGTTPYVLLAHLPTHLYRIVE